MSIDVQHQQRVGKAFASAASRYEKTAVLQKEIAARVLERAQSLKTKPKHIVDVGCGTGYLTRLLQKQYPRAQFLGIDLADGMLQQAKSAEKAWFNKAAYLRADSRQLPLADKSVDLLVSNLMLQWCPDYPKALSEFARVLHPEGYLLLTTFGPETLYELRESWTHVDSYAHVNQFTDMHELGDVCVAAGLQDSVLDIDRITLTHPDIYSVMRHLKHIGANHVRGERPQGLYGKDKFATLAQAYEQYRQDGVLPATYEVIYVYARGASLAKLGAQAQQEGEVKIPVDAIMRPDKA